MNITYLSAQTKPVAADLQRPIQCQQEIKYTASVTKQVQTSVSYIEEVMQYRIKIVKFRKKNINISDQQDQPYLLHIKVVIRKKKHKCHISKMTLNFKQFRQEKRRLTQQKNQNSPLRLCFFRAEEDHTPLIEQKNKSKTNCQQGHLKRLD